jgi:hypothetical protein
MIGAAKGDALTEGLGLNRSPNLNLGEAVGLAAGLAVCSVCAFLREPRSVGDAVGDSAVAGEAAVSAGEAVVSALLCWRCFFAGEGDSAGIEARRAEAQSLLEKKVREVTT